VIPLHQFHLICLRVLEKLSEEASLTELLGAIVEHAESVGSIAACVVRIDDDSAPIRISRKDLPPDVSSRLDEIESGRRRIVPDLGLWFEPIRTQGAPGAVIFLRRERGAPGEDDLAFGEACARLAGLAIARKRQEDDRREREAQIAAVLEAVIDGIVTIDQRGRIESFNRAAEKMFGYEAAEVLGRNVSVLMTEAIGAQHDSYIQRYLSTGERHIIGIGREVVARRKDGTTFPLELGVSELWVGEQRKFTGILRDLTMRKQLEARAQQSQKLEAVGTLAAGVSHDFNNLLMGVMGCISIALTKLPGESAARAFLEEAKAASERGSKLTRQLLAFSRRTPSEAVPMRLNDVVQGTELMLRRLVTEEIELIVELDESGGPIRGDVGQIEQILMNLVVNARDAIKGRGHIGIRTSIEQRTLARPSSFVCLTVSDDGCGMDERVRAHVFEPFFTTKSPDRGTGLGLSTVYGIVEQHGGFVEVESEVGAGTSMRIFFPLHRAEAVVDPAPVMAASGREKILVAEDDRLVRLGISHFLNSAGYQVAEAGTGAEAMDQMRTLRPDLLLADLVMPDMGGLELIANARKVHPRLAVLVMSGCADEEKVDAITAQRIAFLEKPFSYDDLSRSIRSVFEASRSVPSK
jgi:two-component system, cell cycle sensor histidine kinase and response regulator CckA